MMTSYGTFSTRESKSIISILRCSSERTHNTLRLLISHSQSCRAPESTDTGLRYAAYGSRIRTILLSAHRYVAYTSDIGESFRPVAHPILIRSAYAVSWAYLAGDVSYEGYKAYLRNQRILHPEKVEIEQPKEPEGGFMSFWKSKVPVPEPTPEELAKSHNGKVPIIEDYRAVMVQRGVFQALASMGLPAFTIHSIVKYSGRAMKNNKNVVLRTWAPIGLGLAAVPFLPYIFDEPVETAVEWTFHKGFEAVWGAEAVHGRPVTGNKELRMEESKEGAMKEKLKEKLKSKLKEL